MKNWILIVCLGLSVAAVGLNLFRSPGGSLRVGFVRTDALLKDFQGAKEANEKLGMLEREGKNTLDSLKVELEAAWKAQQAGGSVSRESLMQLERAYEGTRQNFEGRYAGVQQEALEQLTTQVNAYALDFGKARGFDLVLAANGTGTLLYAGDALDVTDEFVKYLNERYEGK